MTREPAASDPQPAASNSIASSDSVQNTFLPGATCLRRPSNLSLGGHSDRVKSLLPWASGEALLGFTPSCSHETAPFERGIAAGRNRTGLCGSGTVRWRFPGAHHTSDESPESRARAAGANPIVTAKSLRDQQAQGICPAPDHRHSGLAGTDHAIRAGRTRSGPGAIRVVFGCSSRLQARAWSQILCRSRLLTASRKIREGRAAPGKQSRISGVN